jgi:hypothetical protein
MEAVDSLPANSPVSGGTRALTEAEAEALGLYSSGGSPDIDGYVGLSSLYPINYSTTGTAVSGQYGAVSALEHEISEVMGRTESLGTYVGSGDYTPLDLFRYASAGVPAVTPGAGYFSLDQGTTNLAPFNDPRSGGDAGDWDSSVANDAFGAALGAGTVNPVSAVDLAVMNVLGYATAVACYAEGTRLRTLSGDVRVEDLAIGDTVQTILSGPVPIKWIGHRAIDCGRHPDPRLVCPVQVRRGAFGDDLPYRDLFLSPDHAVAVDGVLIPVRLLLNGATIVQDTARRHIRYFHVELDRHDLLLAEGLAAESYLDTGNRGMFDTAGHLTVLHPDFGARTTPRRETRSCLPFTWQPEVVRPIWSRLAALADAIGYKPACVATSDDPDLFIVNGLRRLTRLYKHSGQYAFLVPGATRDLRLRSRHAAPSATRPWLEDRRELGVMVQRMSIRDAGSRQDVALDSPALDDGWWAPEGDGATVWRWTNGDAVLPPVDAPSVIEIFVGDTVPYPMAPAADQVSWDLVRRFG